MAIRTVTVDGKEYCVPYLMSNLSDENIIKQIMKAPPTSTSFVGTTIGLFFFVGLAIVVFLTLASTFIFIIVAPWVTGVEPVFRMVLNIVHRFI
jgi:hypothetical protein